MDFILELINDFFGTPDVDIEDTPDDYDAITNFLTRGNVTSWFDRLPSSRLTSLRVHYKLGTLQ